MGTTDRLAQRGDDEPVPREGSGTMAAGDPARPKPPATCAGSAVAATANMAKHQDTGAHRDLLEPKGRVQVQGMSPGSMGAYLSPMGCARARGDLPEPTGTHHSPMGCA